MTTTPTALALLREAREDLAEWLECADASDVPSATLDIIARIDALLDAPPAANDAAPRLQPPAKKPIHSSNCSCAGCSAPRLDPPEPFVVGQCVVCVDASGTLVAGAIYTIRDVMEDDEEPTFRQISFGDNDFWLASRFRPADKNAADENSATPTTGAIVAGSATSTAAATSSASGATTPSSSHTCPGPCASCARLNLEKP